MENVSLREFIETREAEIKQLRSKLLKELKELKAAKKAIEDRGESPTGETSKSKLTIKQMVLEVLKDFPDGTTADKLLEIINSRFEMDIVRSSLSPQLSRLKKERQIDLDDRSNTWRLRSVSRESPQHNYQNHVAELGVFSPDRATLGTEDKEGGEND